MENQNNPKLTQALSDQYRSFTGFFIRNYRFTYLIILAVFILGVFSLSALPREANPEVEIPFAGVSVFYPGANPTDVEELVTDKIEADIKNLENMKRYTSQSGQGISNIFVEFQTGTDIDENVRKLREAVDKAEAELPPEAEKPIVQEVNFTDMPIITYSLVCGADICDLKKAADDMAKKLEEIPNVSRVDILGSRKREFQVIVDQTKLSKYGLSITQINNAIARGNFNLPAGNIEIDGFKYNVRVEGGFDDISSLSDIVIASLDGIPVYIKDVASVQDGFEEKTTDSKIGFPGEEPGQTISLQIFKRTGGNILQIVDRSKEVIEEMQARNEISNSISVQMTNDNSVFIREDLGRLGSSAVQTMILIVLFLMIVLSFRGAIITGLSIPIAFLLTFIFLYVQGMTLNSLVLFSLVLALGLMVDNSIIIIEGINEYITEHGKDPFEAAMLSVWNYKWPVIAGTMTTVSAFLPILLVSGILGEFIGVLPKTISAALISSLFVALIVIPTLASRFIKVKAANGRTHRDKKRHIYVKKHVDRLKSKYEITMRRLLASKKKRRLLIAAAWILFLASVAMPASGLMRIQMFPEVDIDYFIVNIKLPPGSTLEKTEELTSRVERIVSSLDDLDNYVSNLGSNMVMDMSEGGSSGTHLANITVNLKKEGRKRKSFEIARDLRPILKDVQGAEITVEELSAGPPSGSPIEIRINGDNLTDLSNTANKVKGYLTGRPGLINIRDSLEETTGEFTFAVDRRKADYYNLDTVSIASALRNALFGSTASRVSYEGEEIDITVKYARESFKAPEDLLDLVIISPQGQNIPLRQVAGVELKPSLLSIAHRDGERVVYVRADAEANADISAAAAEFSGYIAQETLPEGVSVEIGGETEDIEQSFRETFMSMILAIILIAFILILQFNSFKQPFIILFTLPLAIIGVIFGLNILFLPFSFTVFIGLVALAGIVVNDAIVLIDRINKNIDSGADFTESIIEGGTSRMQPIFLTSITTIAGIFPLLFADELWRGLGITVIFGLIFSTFLTLVLVPVMYAGLCRGERCK
jgi:multidrug efflux pump subunit AcrB